jgi:large subunit ribosomal protein L15
MDLSSLKPAQGAKRNTRRLGRGPGSGHGKTAGRGHNGQNSRSGGGVGPRFEGGQMPLHRRLPKRGFHNIFRTEYSIVNVGDLARFEAGTEVDPTLLISTGLVRKLRDGVKILSVGELAVALKVKAHKFSKKAEEKIVSAGGSVEKLEK